MKSYPNMPRRYDNGGKHSRSRTISQKCSDSLPRCRRHNAKTTAAVGGTGGGLVYPDNSVVTVLFYFQAAAITSNLLLTKQHPPARDNSPC